MDAYKRFLTREVRIGDTPLGGNQPIRLQSMTTTDTMDTVATVNQCVRMIEAGCEYIRLTAPSINEAKNLEHIKKELRHRGFNVPLIADIHYTPNAAEWAARIVEKVRINPGNYADKKNFQVLDYSDADYQQELDRIRSRFLPLVKICKEYGTAMRIGTNHGSLSDRILSRYGDTPEGMVESAFEFLSICESEGFQNIVLSMKASNTLVMVQAYRLLVKRMKESNRNYPLHLGVTEAGDGEDGRIKSAVGIGTLLEEGYGDTIRVSLTEDPEFELPVARTLAQRYAQREPLQDLLLPRLEPVYFSPFAYQRKSSQKVLKLGGGQVPVVVADLSSHAPIALKTLQQVGYTYDQAADKWHFADLACDFIYVGKAHVDPAINLPQALGVVMDAEALEGVADKARYCPYYSWEGFALRGGKMSSARAVFVALQASDLKGLDVAALRDLPAQLVWVLQTDSVCGVEEQRRLAWQLEALGSKHPIVLQRRYEGLSEHAFQLYSATDVGALLIDGVGDGIWLSAAVQPEFVNRVGFGILQATRTRISKTEYISCPSCGRTLFDLQETTAKIRQQTDHLKGLKIGIMGCIVNGPGEMADADYGYVGTGVGKITLYKGKEVMKRNIASAEAVGALIALIKEHGDWVDPQ